MLHRFQNYKIRKDKNWEIVNVCLLVLYLGIMGVIRGKPPDPGETMVSTDHEDFILPW